MKSRKKLQKQAIQKKDYSIRKDKMKSNNQIGEVTRVTERLGRTRNTA